MLLFHCRLRDPFQTGAGSCSSTSCMRATSPSSANRLPRSVDHQPLALPPPSSSTAADGGPLLNHSTSVQTGGRSGEHRSVKDDDDALLLDGGWDDVREALLVAESDRDTTVTSLRHALPLPEPGSSSSLAVTNATGGTTGTTESFDDSLQAVPQLSAAFPAAVSVPVSAFSFDPWSDRQPSAFASTFVASLDSSSRHVGASTYTSHAGDEGASVAQRYHLGDTFTGTHYDLGQHAAAVQIPQQYASVPSSSFGLPLQQQQQHSQQRQHWLGSAPAHVLDRAVGGGGPAAHHANTPVSSQPFDYRDGHGPPVPLHQHLAPYSPSEPSYDRNTGGLDRRLPQRAGSTTDHQRHSYQRPPSGALAFAPKPPNAASRRPAQPPTPAAPLHVRRLAADRTASAKPGLAAGPSPPSSSSARPPAGLKLRSGLPERTSYAMWIGSAFLEYRSRVKPFADKVLIAADVPADATEAELWAFFLKLPPLVPSQGGGNGLQSVHLIARRVPVSEFSLCGLPCSHAFRLRRSQCAFLNLDTEAHLLHTIAHSHGLLLRPHDPKCKPFVCRLRRVEDDAKSGVGAQRGGGLHRAWVAETKERLLLSPQKQQSRQQSQPPRFDSHDGVDDESGRRSVDSTSTNSTDSEFFKEHFPKVSGALRRLLPLDARLMRLDRDCSGILFSRHTIGSTSSSQSSTVTGAHR